MMHHADQEAAGVARRPYAFTASNVIDPDIHMPARVDRPGALARLLRRMPGLRWLAH
ncbi:hypothetical protein ACFVTX_08670 [Agromyces sp. NPDC058136]|uniref:hypothetical protein n=1 Tax=Agromyces sp. NPDC058136 TaxID=3346354 RepID=UPI0036DD265D